MGISSALGSQALVPAGFGFRNLIINGDFRINQRGFSSTTTTGTYGFDRWFMLGSGGTTTYSAQTFTIGNPISGQEPTNFARVVTTGQSAATDLSILIHRIEDVRNCAGQTVTVSFWAKAASGTPKVAVELDQSFGSGGSPSSAVYTLAGTATLSTSWTRYSFTVNLPSISGKTLGSNNDHFLGLNLWLSGGSNFNSRTGSLGIQSATFDFWGVQVEANNVPTSFERRPIGVELALCQRYYAASSPTGVQGGVMTYPRYGSDTFRQTTIFFPQTLRKTPTSSDVSITWSQGYSGGGTDGFTNRSCRAYIDVFDTTAWTTVATWTVNAEL